jgi:hypothetical protein
MTDLATNNTSIFSYSLNSYVDPNPKDPVDGLAYSNNVLQNCSITQMTLTPPRDLVSSLDAEVIFSLIIDP